MTDKEEWIINYLKSKEFCAFVDILDDDFVNAFIDKYNTKFEFIGLGAPKCKELSKLLLTMNKKGLLHRWAHGVRSGLCQDGKFPKWVYSYKLP